MAVHGDGRGGNSRSPSRLASSRRRHASLTSATAASASRSSRPNRSNLPSSPRLTLSDNVSVPVNVVWQRKSGADTWVCGMAVDDEHRPAWRELVDTLSS